MPFTLTSRAFTDGQPIPARYTSMGANVSPPLEWSGAPGGTRELALICEDPDAPLPKPFVHWIVYGIQPDTSYLPEGLPKEDEIRFPVLARQAVNSMLQPGYLGPNPPFWHGAHRYYFKLFALSKPLTLPPSSGREEFYKAIEGFVLEDTVLLGTFEKDWAMKIRSAIPYAAGILGIAGSVYALRRRRRMESSVGANL